MRQEVFDAIVLEKCPFYLMLKVHQKSHYIPLQIQVNYLSGRGV